MNKIKSITTTQISLIRHGTVHNPENIFYGRLPGFRLARRGKDEASLTAQILKNSNISGIYSSPLLRARQTAREIIKYHSQLTLKTSKLISEVFTPYQGESFQSIESKKWDIYTDCPAGFEQPIDILLRVNKFIWRIRRKYPGKYVVAVTHGDVILFLLLWAKKCEIIPQNKIKFQSLKILNEYPATGSITTLKFVSNSREEFPEVDYVNPNNYWK